MSPTGSDPKAAQNAQAAARPTKRRAGPLTRRESGFAYRMLLPTVFIVAAVVLFPLLATIWISFKPIGLSDLRPPAPVVRERVRGEVAVPGDTLRIEYRLRNSSQEGQVTDVALGDQLPAGLEISDLDPRCSLDGRALSCALGDWPGGFRETLALQATAMAGYFDDPVDPGESTPQITGSAANALLALDLTLDNFAAVFDARQFWTTLWITFAYTIFGTIGALVMGLFAAQLLHEPFTGRGLLRGLFLFPYVAPVIAMAFTWIILLDPFSGALNALLRQMGAIEEPINFFGVRQVPIDIFGLEVNFPLALSMVIAFEAWRYFPLSFMFILARMQSIPKDMYEAAEMDGASPFQQFWELSLPQLFGILSVLFLLRFIWTFNKFDDIFLLTGGNAGTRTLTVDVYERGFALNNLGAGAAVAVVIFVILITLALAYFRAMPKEEGL